MTAKRYAWCWRLIAFASIIFGNLMALSQTNIKRLLGYSSISHLGYLLVALIALQSGEMSMEAVGVYLAGYLFSSLGAFGVVSLMSSPYRGPDADSLFSYRGLFWHRPILAAVMTVMMLSLAGIPMTLGFIGKFYVLAVGVQAHLWWLVAAVVVGSAIGLYYYLRVAVSLYLQRPGATGSRCAVKLAVQRGRYRGADLCTVGTGAGCMAATADQHRAVSDAADVSSQFVSQKAADMFGGFFVVP